MIGARLDHRVADVAANFKRAMLQVYGDKLADVLVYQTVVPDLDGDLLVANMVIILREIDDVTAEIERTGYAASRLEMMQDGHVSIGREFFLESDWEAVRHRYSDPPSSCHAIPA